MSGSVNKVILVGNLGKDPEVRRLESGVAVASFPVATNESYTDKNSGERKTITEWHNVTLWRGLAETAEKYLRKGKLVYIEGKLRTRSYDDKDNVTRYVTEVVADTFTMLGPRTEEGSGGGPAPVSTSQANPGPVNKSAAGSSFDTSGDDDLPF